jgi:hypothetical protein
MAEETRIQLSPSVEVAALDQSERYADLIGPHVTSWFSGCPFRKMDYDTTDIAATYDRSRDHGPEFS